jgi:hypothetical protein
MLWGAWLFGLFPDSGNLMAAPKGLFFASGFFNTVIAFASGLNRKYC